ncbi:hypothetical protein, conserved [Eimeria tenella]|uniref:Uncharacterized protein n=1 Tax=Eimeria tenella TaxID=5802 RepID=U6KSD8_EIMTE|nr:hypothetical protein, conserved [Eimeria tenella]CDJ41017.1 hypothetical protein, conserved [Eimeria tenella]|eukprot:XP_013231767.1 hypothetical protein, conserved [Eimeria tenella]
MQEERGGERFAAGAAAAAAYNGPLVLLEPPDVLPLLHFADPPSPRNSSSSSSNSSSSSSSDGKACAAGAAGAAEAPAPEEAELSGHLTESTGDEVCLWEQREAEEAKEAQEFKDPAAAAATAAAATEPITPETLAAVGISYDMLFPVLEPHDYPIKDVSRWSRRMLTPEEFRSLKAAAFRVDFESLPKSELTGLYFNRHRPCWSADYYTRQRKRKTIDFFVPVNPKP